MTTKAWIGMLMTGGLCFGVSACGPKLPEESTRGKLLHSEPIQDVQVPGRALRIRYVSEAETGAREDVSAAVFVPEGTAPADGWPIIAWAHGTVGVAEGCAPSLRRNLFYDEYPLCQGSCRLDRMIFFQPSS